MNSKTEILLRIGHADCRLEQAISAPSLAAAWVHVTKAMEHLSFSAGMADERARWKSQHEAAVALRALAHGLLSVGTFMLDPDVDQTVSDWAENLADIRLDLYRLASRGKFR